MTEKRKSIKEVLQNEEIKLTDLFILFAEKKRVLFASILVVVFLGLVKSCTSPVEYESVAIMLSEVEAEGGKMGQLGGLAGLAGINLSGLGSGSSSSTFSPELYPKLLESKPFLLALIEEEFYFETKQKKMSIKDYYLEERPADLISKSIDFTTALPYYIFSLFESNNKNTEIRGIDSVFKEEEDYVFISPSENYVIAEIKNRIKIESKGRIITLAVKMPEPLVAAEFNVLVFNEILDFVSNYQIEKQRNNLLFIEKSTIAAEENFKKAQLNLASFRDSNQGVISQRIKTREEQLELEGNLSFQLYSTLKQELESSKIELKKETPIFTTFEKAMVPNGPSNSSPAKIIILSVFLGGFLGGFLIFILLGRDYIKD